MKYNSPRSNTKDIREVTQSKDLYSFVYPLW
jgi:hypothetical protein